MQREPAGTPAERFATIVGALAGETGVEGPGEIAPRRMFGSAAQLRVNGKIFAMLMEPRLVLKLPRQRVAELLADDATAPFSNGAGRVMKEWIAVSPESQAGWLALAQEAMAFVRGTER